MSNDKDDSFTAMFERVMGEGAVPPSVEDDNKVPTRHRMFHNERAALLGTFERVEFDKLELLRKNGHISAKVCARRQTELMDKAGIPEFSEGGKRPEYDALMSEGLHRSFADRNERLVSSARIDHSVRIKLLKGKDRENFDQVMEYMREDHRSNLHIYSVQEILLSKAGVPECYEVKREIIPMEWCGHWFDPLTGAAVPNPNVKYNSYPISNIADPLKEELDKFYRQIDEDISYELSPQVAVDGRSLEVVRVIKQKFVQVYANKGER